MFACLIPICYGRFIREIFRGGFSGEYHPVIPYGKVLCRIGSMVFSTLWQYSLRGL